MTVASEIRLVLTTVPDAETGQRIADALVGERLAACVSQLPGLISTYLWQGELQRETESALLIKSAAETYPMLEARLRELHPYQLPEILALTPAAGLPAYLSWVLEHSTCPI